MEEVNNMQKKDLTGQIFGRLTVIKEEYNKNKQFYYLCQCECGNTTVTRGDLLRAGKVKSCGCLQDEVRQDFGKKSEKHYLYDNRSYTTTELCELGKISKSTFYRLLKEGKTIEEIIKIK